MVEDTKAPPAGRLVVAFAYLGGLEGMRGPVGAEGADPPLSPVAARVHAKMLELDRAAATAIADPGGAADDGGDEARALAMLRKIVSVLEELAALRLAREGALRAPDAPADAPADPAP